MRSRYTLRLALAVILLAFATAGLLRAAVPASRLAGVIADTATVAQSGSIHPMVRRAVDHGRLDAATPLPGLSLNFAPSTAQQTAIDALLRAQQDPSSPSYHQWLTPTQYGKQFGMTVADLAQITAWLQSHGFTVERIAPSSNAIHFSGTAGQVEQAFHTELHSLTLDGEAYFANTTEPALPAAFASTVSAIRGLNDFHLKPRARATAKLVPYTTTGRAGSTTPFATDGKGNEFLAPEDFAKIYDVNALYNAGFNGSASYPIAIVGQTAVRTSDITDFRTAFGLTTNTPTMVLVPNTGASAITSTDDLGESELDLEWSGAVAPSAPVYFLYTGNSSTNGNFNYGVFDALQYAIQTYTVSGKPVPIVSISYGECEPSDTTANYTTYEKWFQQANLQGQTIINSSGDDGAAGCDYATTVANNYAATQGLAVDYPASSAYVTGVGGTSFSADLTAQSTYWGTSNDTVYGNELGLYIPSSTWNDTPTTATAVTQTGLSASGGGVSVLWPKPSWQSSLAGVPTDGKRDVPDLALNADPNHDGFLVCINLGCEGTNASFNIYGGTSASAPSFAAILALTEQKLAATQGNINPSLYKIAQNSTTYASAFHDVTTGTNIVPCVVSATDTGCTGGSMGYSAGTGYDLVTGLGSPDAANLANALGGIPALIATTETLAYTPTSPSTNQSVTFTATIAHTTGTAVPTGTVTFTVDSAASGTQATVSSTGTATFATTFTTGGAHTVSAVYSGDATYNGSSATSTVTVIVLVTPTSAATTTTLTAAPSTIAVGSSLTLTANVSSTVGGTLAGTVTFSTAAGTLGTKAVTAGAAGNTGTAVFTVSVALASLPVGTDTITATFGGGGTDTSGGSFLASSGTASVTVNNPTITLTATNISVASGSSGSSTITITSGGSYSGNVALTASTNSTLSATAAFNPATVAIAAGGTGTSTLTLTGVTASAKAGSGTLSTSRLGNFALGGGLAFASLLFFGTAGLRRKRLASLLTALIVTAAAAGLVALQGCSSSSSPLPPTTGSYTVTITGTDSTTTSITGTTSITVTIH